MDKMISIVIPTHNRSGLLRRAVDSALKQTYKSTEIIVVSDGSEDDTDTVMAEYVNKYPNVHFHSYKPAQGGNHARNIGIANAAGEYMAFLDDDDEWYPFKLEKQYALMESDPAIGLTCTGILSRHEGTSTTVPFIPDARYDASKQILLKNCIGSTTTVMVRRALFEKAGVFDEKLGALQDYDMWIRLCQITKVGVIKEPCVDYWNYENSNQISKYTDKYENAILHIDEKYKDLVDARLSDGEKKQRISFEQLLIAKKAIRNGAPSKSRHHALQAWKAVKSTAAISCFAASFAPKAAIRKVKAVIRRIKK